MGQNFLTSTYVGENLFAIVIAILGLVLFGLLIGNMQVRYFQNKTWHLESSSHLLIVTSKNDIYHLAVISAINCSSIGGMAKQEDRHREVDAKQAAATGAEAVC